MRIVVRKEGKVLSSHEIGDQVLYFGRSKKNDVVLLDSSVSRRHAKVFKTGGQIYLEDLKSVNGTLYNDGKIRRVELHGGDRFRIGIYEFGLEIDERTEFDPVAVAEPTAETTFAEASTDTAPPDPTLPRGASSTASGDFLDAIAVRPKTQAGAHPPAAPADPKLAVLKAFLETERTPADFLPQQEPARLVRLDGPDAGHSIPIEKPEVTLGGPQSQAVIENTGEAFVLKSPDESTGTFVDGVPVRERELENHDVVQIGSEQFEFVRGASRSRAERPPVIERAPKTRVFRGAEWRERFEALKGDWRFFVGVGVVVGLVTVFILTLRGTAPRSPAENASADVAAAERERTVRFNLDRARALLAGRKYDEAESRLVNILEKLKPGDAEATALLKDLDRARAAVEPAERPAGTELLPAAKSGGKKDVRKTRTSRRISAERLRRSYQKGVLKFESGDLKGARESLEEVASAEGTRYAADARKLLAEIRNRETAAQAETLKNLKATADSGDLLTAFQDSRKFAQQNPDNPKAVELYNRIRNDLEAKAGKAYKEGIMFLEVVEDRASALDRFQEAERLSPDPSLHYYKKARDRIRQLRDAPTAN